MDGREIKYAYILIVKSMHTFLAYHVILLLVVVMILNRVPFYCASI